jgi:hypothetical protein
MARQHIYLKCETEYFQAIEKGLKTFEVRKNDRLYEIGDLLYLQEIVGDVFTGREIRGCEIIYILPGGKFGIDPDYFVMQLKIPKKGVTKCPCKTPHIQQKSK